MSLTTLCRRDPLSVRRSDEVIKAARLMRERHVAYLVLTESLQSGVRERPVGVLTDRDIVVSVVARKLNSERATVGEVMTQPPVTVCEADPVEKALREMRRVGVRRLPLVDQQGMLLGIVSHDTVLAFVGRGLRSIMDSIGEYPDK